ncbi:M23 family metallopeptidase [Saccharopolyspora taberi]|uniref:M23 family metallopeptidase n=1 Tax=Saccharopolyspora taberi TaxID=60895 RepID=A0ABN3VIW3_9PSEU
MLRGRVVVAAVAAGAFVAAGQSMAAGEGNPGTEHDDFELASNDAAASFGTAADSYTGMGGSAPAPEVLPVAQTTDGSAELAKLNRSSQVTKALAQEEATRIAAEEAAKRPKIVSPAAGRFTSGFGGRWGTTHYGIDIANAKGTPIVSVADGTVIEAGPASGFGLWVRVQHDDGTITVYGHVNTITVSEGETVKAGDQIATMGNRGFSTGTHLHFEVWNASGKKINPLPWLQERGVSVA